MHVRAGEAEFQNYFRCDRFFQINSQWHFTTREQTVEGPFATKVAAKEGLKRYVKLLSCHIFNGEERQTINTFKVIR